jgi:putative endopeptidase
LRPLCLRAARAALIGLFTFCAAAHAATSGINQDNTDASVRPQDNFYRFVNGKWLASAKIPDDLPAYGSYWTLREDTQAQLQGIVEAAALTAKLRSQAEVAKIGLLYLSLSASHRCAIRAICPR